MQSTSLQLGEWMDTLSNGAGGGSPSVCMYVCMYIVICKAPLVTRSSEVLVTAG